jgi:hypothetical protein
MDSPSHICSITGAEFRQGMDFHYRIRIERFVTPRNKCLYSDPGTSLNCRDLLAHKYLFVPGFQLPMTHLDRSAWFFVSQRGSGKELVNSWHSGSSVVQQAHTFYWSLLPRLNVGIRRATTELRDYWSTMQIKSLVYWSSTFILALSSTTQDVLNDLTTLRFWLNTLDHDLNNFSGSIAGALVSLINNHEKYVLDQAIVRASITMLSTYNLLLRTQLTMLKHRWH